jgi:hypothetical protein
MQVDSSRQMRVEEGTILGEDLTVTDSGIEHVSFHRALSEGEDSLELSALLLHRFCDTRGQG